MAKIAEIHRKQHPRIKQNIDNSYRNFDKNRKRFVEMRNFTFITSIDENQKAVLAALEKPQLEFNILESYVNRLCGEFSKAEPSIKVSSAEGNNLRIDDRIVDQELMIQTVKAVEGNLRYILKQANKDGLEYKTYRNTLSGGYSAIKICTQYASEMSFHQDICMKTVFDPTLCGWDPLAKLSDKTDGDYCFEIVPQRLEEFMKEYPGVDVSQISFQGAATNSDNIGPFAWSFTTGKDKILLVADYYEKKKKKEHIVLLTDGTTKTREEYEAFLMEWDERQYFAQPPQIMAERKTEITKIIRYKVIESGVIEKEETDFSRLPIIFIDGNSIETRLHDSTDAQQYTRPLVMQAIGQQKLMNFAGESLAEELQNMGPQKIIATLEGLDDDYLEGYINPQKAGVIVSRAFLDGDATKPLPMPQLAPRTQTPPVILETFMNSPSIIQNILGNFDLSMSKMAEGEMSGIAYQEMATMSNASAMPYVVNFLRGLESAARMCIELMPLYYTTPRSIPVITGDGKHTYVPINQDEGLSLNYEADALGVCVEAGASFSVQQSKALNQIIALSRAIPSFGEFINQSAVDLVLDNVEIRNVEELRLRSETWMKEQKEQAQKMQEQQAQQPNVEQQAIEVAKQQVESEAQVGMARVQLQASTEQLKAQLKEKEFSLEQQRIQMETLKILADIKNSQAKLGIESQKVENQRIEKMIDSSISVSEHHQDINDRQFDKALRSLDALTAHEERKDAVREAGV